MRATATKLDISMWWIVVLVALGPVSAMTVQIAIKPMRADLVDGRCNATLVPVTKTNQTVLHVVEQINQKAPDEKQATWLALCHYNNLTTWQQCFRPSVPLWWGCYDVASVNNRMHQLSLASTITKALSAERIAKEAKTCGGKVTWHDSAAGPHIQLCNHVRWRRSCNHPRKPQTHRLAFTTTWSTSATRASNSAHSAGAAATPTCSS